MRSLLNRLLFAAAALCGSAHAQAPTDFPTHPIRLLVPSPPGGGGDTLARLLADHLSKRLGQPFIVENNPGASGTIAISQTAKAAPDGYTIALGTMTALMLAPAVLEKSPYDPIRDIVPLARIGTSPIVMLAASDAPVDDLTAFISLAKSATEPVQYGTWGVGSTGHFCAEVLKQKTGVKVSHVPYNGTAPVMRALLSGEIKYAFLDAATATAAVQTKKIKAIAMCTRRIATFPNVATYKEQGVDFDQWTGWSIVAPAGIPQNVKDKYDDALRAVISDPAVAARLEQWGITPDFVAGAEQATVNEREFEIWKKLARDANIRPE